MVFQNFFCQSVDILVHSFQKRKMDSLIFHGAHTGSLNNVDVRWKWAA